MCRYPFPINSCQGPNPGPNTPLPGMIPTPTTFPSSTVTSESVILITPPTALRGGIPILATSTSTSLDNSPTEGPNATLPFRVPLIKPSTSRFTTSVRFTTDPSGTTDITSIGILPTLLKFTDYD